VSSPPSLFVGDGFFDGAGAYDEVGGLAPLHQSIAPTGLDVNTIRV
jgi:hypothetical protein